LKHLSQLKKFSSLMHTATQWLTEQALKNQNSSYTFFMPIHTQGV